MTDLCGICSRPLPSFADTCGSATCRAEWAKTAAPKPDLREKVCAACGKVERGVNALLCRACHSDEGRAASMAQGEDLTPAERGIRE